jgi:hypothetical protein
MAATACIRLLLLFSAAGTGTTRGTHSCLSCQQWSLTACCLALPSQRLVGRWQQEQVAAGAIFYLPLAVAQGSHAPRHCQLRQAWQLPSSMICDTGQAGAVLQKLVPQLHAHPVPCVSPVCRMRRCTFFAVLQVHRKQVSAQDQSAAAPSGAALGMVSSSLNPCRSTSSDG